ncbi:MAG: universal stress protein [Cyclobacteriaceae bacterium]
MNTILVPSDFSTCSQNALNYALLIARSLHTDIKLLHVYPSNYEFAPKTEEYEHSQEENAEDKFAELERRIREREEYRNLPISTEIRKGEVITEIVRAAADCQAGMIIMGTLGAGGIKHVIGSNTSEVIDETYLPVLAIPANFRPDKVKRMVFATDLHQKDIKILSTLAPIVTSMHLPLEIIHVFDHKDEEENLYNSFVERVKDNIPAASVTFHKLNNYDVEKGLANLVHGYNDALLTLTVYKKDFFEKLLGQNIAEDIVLSGTTPVLVLKSEEN